VRGRIEQVLGWAIVGGFRGGDNPARWRGHLDQQFPKKGKVRAVEHFEAMPFAEVPAFLAELRQKDTLAAQGLELLILTATRRDEVRGATWDEIDLTAKTWTIPRQAHERPQTASHSIV
jgi:integrase